MNGGCGLAVKLLEPLSAHGRGDNLGGFGAQGPQCWSVLYHSPDDGPWTSTQETHWFYRLCTTGVPTGAGGSVKWYDTRENTLKRNAAQICERELCAGDRGVPLPGGVKQEPLWELSSRPGWGWVKPLCL